MGTEVKTGFLGIVTNTADLQAPAGGLEKAKNVVIRRAGACEPRPGLKPDVTRSNTQRTIKIIPYELETLLANNNSEWWDALTNTSVTYTLPDASVIGPATFRNDLIPHVQTRGNLYVGTSRGSMKWTGGGTEFQTTGNIPAAVIADNGSVAGVALANNMRFAYRLVHKRTDANGLVIRSRPSGYYVVSNTSGGTVNPTLSLFVQADRQAWFDEIEVYRSRAFPLTVQFDEEYQLVGVVQSSVLTGTPIASTTYTDATIDANRGATLYTSPSREGEEGANDRPHASGAMAVFKGAVFTGNTIGPARKVVSYTFQETLAGSANGVGKRIYTGTVANGSAVVTAMASTVGLQAGMVVRPQGGVIQQDTTILSVDSANQITMTKTALTSGAGTNLVFLDAIQLDGVWYPISGFGTNSPLTLEDVLAVGGQPTFPNTPSEIFSAYDVTPPVTGFTNTLVIEEMIITPTATRAIRATHGNEYSPALPLSGATAATMDRDTYPNVLRWSKSDEPEHFPPANYERVGDKKRAILGLVATRDALFIFKEDGIWRLTGTNGQYRTDPFDLTTRCVLPSSIVPLKNRIFMLSNRGVVAVSDEGVEVVSMAIDDQLKKLIYTLDVAGAGSGYFLTNVGYAGAACERDNEYMLLVGSALLAERSNIFNGALVYNDVTRAWTSWEFSNSGGMALTPYTWAFHDRYGTLKLAQRVSLQTYLYFAEPGAAFTNGQTWRCDNTAAITVSGTPAGGVISYGPSTQLIAGDVLYNVTTGSSAVVTVGGLTSVTVDNIAGFADTNSVTAIRPVACNVAPRAFTEQNLRIKQWVGINAEFSLLAGACTASFSSLASLMTNTSTKIVTPFDIKRVSAETRYLTGASIRGVFPVQAARGYRMQAEVAWSHGWGDSTLEAIFVETVDGKANAPNLAVSQ